ncbi:hypothetical protein DsansV1_C34g0225221 [Dioscorea sansibarensis]
MKLIMKQKKKSSLEFINHARKQILPHSIIQYQFQSNQNQNKLSETMHILPCTTKRQRSKIEP